MFGVYVLNIGYIKYLMIPRVSLSYAPRYITRASTIYLSLSLSVYTHTHI